MLMRVYDIDLERQMLLNPHYVVWVEETGEGLCRIMTHDGRMILVDETLDKLSAEFERSLERMKER